MTATQLLGNNITKSFNDRPALTGVDLAAQGGLVAVLGPNGAGKTTLLRCIATVLVPDGGSLLIDGLNPCLLYTSPSPRDRTRSRMPSSA